jgi:hypothetical protein
VFILAKRHHSSANLPSVKDQAGDRPATLRDLLDADVIGKLKAAAEQLKAEEQQKKEKLRKEAEEARKAEQKRLENDFAHLLENSDPDWRKYK